MASLAAVAGAVAPGCPWAGSGTTVTGSTVTFLRAARGGCAVLTGAVAQAARVSVAPATRIIRVRCRTVEANVRSLRRFMAFIGRSARDTNERVSGSDFNR